MTTAAWHGPCERAPLQVEDQRLEVAARNDNADGKDRDDRGRVCGNSAFGDQPSRANLDLTARIDFALCS
jgi:hypothetical protein